VGTHTYQYDAEGRLVSVDGVVGQACHSTWTACYTYNALGQRVEKTVGGVYTGLAYDAAGRLMEYNNGYAETEDFLWLGNRLIGTYVSGTRFVHPDILGSTGVLTNQYGTETQEELYYPWGSRWAAVGTVEDERFAAMQKRDAETGLDPTPNRMYHWRLGRWLSPDPLGGDITNPQSLNRYAYVLNNPTTLLDPLGLDSCNVNNVSWEGSGTPFPCLGPPPGSSAEYSYDPVAGAFYKPSAMPGGPSNQGLWPESAEMAAGEAAYANHVDAVFASLYMQAQLSGGIPLDQLKPFLSMNPQIKVSFGLLWSEWYVGSGPVDMGVATMNQASIYGYSIVENPLALAGMMASPMAGPWAPAAWYGGSAAVAFAPAAYQGSLILAAGHPVGVAGAVQFGQGFIPGQPVTGWWGAAGFAVSTAWTWWTH
jgi:RHS repeat-associated protein